jgi:hypothetical protein
MENLSGIDVAIITVVGTLLLCAVVIVLYFRHVRGSAYEGIIASKGTSESESNDGGTQTVHFVMVRLTDGQQTRVHVNQKRWKEWAVGQSIVKRAGQLSPELADQAGAV